MLDQVVDYARKQSKYWNYEIIPVDDRSTDQSKKVISNYAKTHKWINPVYRVSDSEQAGNTMGTALLEGSRKAVGDIIIWTMGDRADDPNTYGKIVEKIQSGYELVFGSRYMPGGTWGSLDPTKAFLSSRGTVLARMFFNIPVHDITNAFRGFRKSLLSHIQLDSTGFAISPEFAIKAHLQGFKLGEVPTVYYSRVEGVSNFKLWRMSGEYIKIYLQLFFSLLFGTKYN